VHPRIIAHGSFADVFADEACVLAWVRAAAGDTADSRWPTGKTAATRISQKLYSRRFNSVHPWGYTRGCMASATGRFAAVPAPIVAPPVHRLRGP
jgi:hypothetical protein